MEVSDKDENGYQALRIVDLPLDLQLIDTA